MDSIIFFIMVLLQAPAAAYHSAGAWKVRIGRRREREEEKNMHECSMERTKTGICDLTMHQNFGDNWFCAGAEMRER